MSHEADAAGRDYLRLITTLAHRVRLEDPSTGIWEAADFQWWWRRERASDEIAQLFWVDAAGEPEAAVIFTDWGENWGCDPMVLPSRAEELLPAVWARALDRIEDMSLEHVAVAVRDDDETLRELVLLSGFSAPDESFFVETWLEPADVPPIGELAHGFSLLDRVDRPDGPHHMVARNGDQVAARLSQTSLYRPDLDLWVEDGEGRVAAYGLFWLDPVTGVGLVEPMRTEERYWRRGLARHVLTVGLHRLVSLGATRAKVSYQSDNPAAKHLYLSTGFQRHSSSREYRRSRHP